MEPATWAPETCAPATCAWPVWARTVVGTSWMAIITTAPQISAANPRRQLMTSIEPLNYGRTLSFPVREINALSVRLAWLTLPISAPPARRRSSALRSSGADRPCCPTRSHARRSAPRDRAGFPLPAAAMQRGPPRSASRRRCSSGRPSTMRAIPRTWPSIRLSRFAQDALMSFRMFDIYPPMV